MSQDTNIRFPDAGNGVKAFGPFNVGSIYSVPADIAKHLVSIGAEAVSSLRPATKDKPAETLTPLDSRHAETIGHIRAIEKERSDAKAAKTTTATADAAAQSGDVK